MSLLIDGYNLLHASGVLAGGVGPGTLERARTALLNFLAESLEPRELADVTVVFDARTAPPGLPRASEYRGIKVRFAQRGAEADEEIERLLGEHSAPRRLTVVSSDHRLHRAARRRRAKAIDSDRWCAEVLRRRIERARPKQGARKPAGPPTEAEVRNWMRLFGLEETEPPQPGEPTIPGSPFPAGYAEDVREEDV